MDDKKLFLLDAYALIYRAYYALINSPRTTSDGRNTSAIYGFCNTLSEILTKHNPPYMAVCFDPPGGKTFRHEEYPEYKAGRDKQPEDITLSIPVIKEIIRAWGIKVVEVERYEADDVIGTLATAASKQGFTTYMMTLDKDYGQLVNDNTLMLRPATRGQDLEIRGPKEICARYGLSSPSQVIDLLALEGDASDNVPGCPGVGEKTAVKLIAQWGNVDNMLEHAAEIKGALGRKIADNAEQIRFSRYLVTIKTDVPMDITPEGLRRDEPDYAELRRLYSGLEFKTFLSRLKDDRTAEKAAPATAPARQDDGMGSLFDFADNAPTDTFAEAPTIDAAGISIADGAASVEAWDAEHGTADYPLIALALNIEGESAMSAQLLGITLSVGNGCAESTLYIPVHGDIDRSVAAAVSHIIGQDGRTVLGAAIKRDITVLRRHGIDMPDNYYDIAVAHYLLRPEGSQMLADIAAEMLQVHIPDWGIPIQTLRRGITGDDAQAAARTASRTDAILRLYNPLQQSIADNGHQRLLTDIELPMIRVLADMEYAGVRIDTALLQSIAVEMTSRISALEEEVWQMAGTRFNTASPAQVGEMLFGKMQIDPKAKRTKTGAFSTTEEILEKYRAQWPIVDAILRIRALKKLQSTYIEALPKMVSPADGMVHTTFNQTATATGRLSSNNPNLQNIPIRTAEGRRIRAAFIGSSEGDKIMSCDYSQIELRLMAALSGDSVMLEAFREGKDIHRATAAKVFHESEDAVTDDQRRKAKTANFGIIYGISAFGLSERLGIPRGEAKDLIDGYLRTYPGVDAFIKRSVEQARERGYVETIFGRRRYLPDINSRSATVRNFAERNAVNAPLQGSAADIIKIAMVAIHREMKARGMHSTMILQVHDELVFNVVPGEEEALRTLVTEQMSQAWPQSPVPLDVSTGIADNWLDAH